VLVKGRLSLYLFVLDLEKQNPRDGQVSLFPEKLNSRSYKAGGSRRQFQRP
jgi:hypothetical protein